MHIHPTVKDADDKDALFFRQIENDALSMFMAQQSRQSDFYGKERNQPFPSRAFAAAMMSSALRELRPLSTPLGLSPARE